MSAIILDGKALAAEIIEKVRLETEKLNKKPGLAVIQAGVNPASTIYVKNKEKQATAAGFNSYVIKLPEDVSEIELKAKIEELNSDNRVHGILLQLPLPKHLSEKMFLELINPKKDVDGFHPVNAGKLLLGQKPYAYPCTPKGIITLLKKYDISLSGKNAVVIGRSNIVGKPVSLMLLNENATVTLAHSKTKNLAEITNKADILISAIGKAEFITKDFIKPDAIVVDVGINRTQNGICGDVKFEEVKEIASYITPVPKGVGPMTIATLIENTLELYKNAEL